MRLTAHDAGLRIATCGTISMRLVAAAVMAATLSAPTVAIATLTAGCPDYVFLGNTPRSSDLPDWSDQAQGVAHDDAHWFFTNKSRLGKFSSHWRAVDGDDEGKIDATGIPDLMNADLAEETCQDVEVAPGFVVPICDRYNHFGDPDQHGGYLFIPIENAGGHVFTVSFPKRVAIAVFRTSDLSFVDWVELTEWGQTRGGWVAVHPAPALEGVAAGKTLLYTSNSRVDGTLLRYVVDVAKLEDLTERNDFLTAFESIEVREADGSPLDRPFKTMQGGAFTPWGDLYLSNGAAGPSPDEERGGLHLFRRICQHDDAHETECSSGWLQLVHDSVNSCTIFHNRQTECQMHGECTWNVVTSECMDETDPDFSYEYNPFGPFESGQEPEGIDWWHRDDDPLYPGQLHAILLDNQAGDDQIWFKHYDVGYWCVVGDDTDGDGLADGNEAYAYGTNPLLADTDGDGTNDGADAFPLDPEESADSDGDGMGDTGDADDDNDGVLDADDAFPTDPTEWADADDDGTGDNADLDDDNDGLPDTLDTAPFDPDADDDGLADGTDVEFIEDAIATLAPEVFRNTSGRHALVMEVRLEGIERHIAVAFTRGASRRLGNLRRRIDGCGPEPDRNDWIVDCGAQLEVRARVDLLMANLAAP